MPSPVSTVSLPEQISGNLQITSNPRANAPDSCAQWTGLADYEAGDTIIVITENGAYMAFQTRDGFGAYLPENEIPTDVVIGHSQNQLRYKIP